MFSVESDVVRKNPSTLKRKNDLKVDKSDESDTILRMSMSWFGSGGGSGIWVGIEEVEVGKLGAGELVCFDSIWNETLRKLFEVLDLLVRVWLWFWISKSSSSKIGAEYIEFTSTETKTEEECFDWDVAWDWPEEMEASRVAVVTLFKVSHNSMLN